MRALITGASNGIGLEFAKELSKLGYDLILVARSKEKLEKIKSELKTDVIIYPMDLSMEENVYFLYEKTKGTVNLLINNAGFGLFGEFDRTSLDEELNMIDLNVKAYHILTKLYLSDMIKKNDGRILNVASLAAFQPGPLMSTYYATKSYVYNLSMAIYEELRRKNSNVKIHVLCPGPVNTGFNDRAKIKFGVKACECSFVVKYAINKMFKNKLIIIPGCLMKITLFANRLFSKKFMLKMTYKIQKSKIK